jgi:hypothetical protein
MSAYNKYNNNNSIRSKSSIRRISENDGLNQGEGGLYKL